MRQIKFRAWDKKSCKIHYFDFSGKTIFAYEGEVCGIILPDMQTTLMYNEIGLNENLELMQFTGLKDKNGKEIYEGDILKHLKNCIYIDQGYVNSIVVFFEGNFCIKSETPLRIITMSFRPEVIGNIWENKELLK
jgi:uncharacterized phage protein (TIGR01671 family)